MAEEKEGATKKKKEKKQKLEVPGEKKADLKLFT